MTTLNDPAGRMFIEFFESQGAKFIDADTGDRITVKDNEVVRIKNEEEKIRLSHYSGCY